MISDFRKRKYEDHMSHPPLPDELNRFHTRFEVITDPPERSASITNLADNAGFMVTVAGVRKTFNPHVNIHKVAGHDGILGRVIRACSEQSADVFLRTYSTSLWTRVLNEAASGHPPLFQDQRKAK